ncbi:phosphodiester glycosidase family protein [Melioribacteraceae bacterium 4301-Me]|uniref:phosphodiester glycosidase family protein n=1 Tax=Pyranulibacter aquaticus TaxID=3163344 RepID=UPI0035999320
MKKIFYLIILYSCYFTASYSQAQTAIDSSIAIQQLTPGIFHKHIFDKKDTLSIHVVSLNLKNNSYTVVAVKGNDTLLGRETTSSMVKRINRNHKVIAAINSDFFKIKYGGEPENNLVINGEFAKGTKITDSDYDTFDNVHYQFAITKNNKPFIERFQFEGKIITKSGMEFKINRVNSQTDSNTITLYNHYQGYATPSNNKWKNLEIRLTKLTTNGDTLLCKVTGNWHFGNTKINRNNYILSTNFKMADKVNSVIHHGDTLQILLKLIPDLGKIFTATGGWGRIVYNGKNVADSTDIFEGTFPKFSVTKHPRTGIGFSKDSTTIYLFTVDGRQESSSGVSLKQFADIMIKEGVYQGLNLDGGGSTTMVINNKVVNKPSDKGGERPVGVSIAIIKQKN